MTETVSLASAYDESAGFEADIEDGVEESPRYGYRCSRCREIVKAALEGGGRG